MPRMKTNEEYIIELKEKNKYVEAFEEYKGMRKSIYVKCKICGELYKSSPLSLFNGGMHRKCFDKIELGKILKKDQEEFLKEAKLKNKYVIPIGEYTGTHNDIKCICQECLEEYVTTPYIILHGGRHKKCYDASQTKTNEKFIEELSKINPDVAVISEYKNCKTYVQLRCKKCGNVWKSKPTNILQGKGCPRCKTSIGEKNVSKYLKSKNIQFETQKTFEELKFKRKLKFDFYIPSSNTCIEYDGEQHYNQRSYYYTDENVKRDILKNEFCSKNCIRLIRVPYTLDNYEKVKEYLNYYLSDL